jgi:hypothetical protein
MIEIRHGAGFAGPSPEPPRGVASDSEPGGSCMPRHGAGFAGPSPEPPPGSGDREGAWGL